MVSFTPLLDGSREVKLLAMSYSAPFPGEEWKLVAHYFKTGELKFDESFIFKKLPLSQIADAFEMYKTPGFVKGKILIDSEQ